jgi:hypothetical protein
MQKHISPPRLGVRGGKGVDFAKSDGGVGEGRSEVEGGNLGSQKVASICIPENKTENGRKAESLRPPLGVYC